MPERSLIFLFPLILFFTSQPAFAGVAIYTTPEWQVIDPEPGIEVYLLEDISGLEQSLFPDLPVIPHQAERQIRLRMQQPDLPEQEARLTRAYQVLLSARAIGLSKAPAVVFDEREVVYGTTDIRLAEELRRRFQEQQP